MKLIHYKELYVATGSQREMILSEGISTLSASITREVPPSVEGDPSTQLGLINALSVQLSSNGQYKILAGRTRYTAIKGLMEFGQGFIYHGGKKLPEGMIPCNVQLEMSKVHQLWMELDENDIRTNLSAQERLKALATIQKEEKLALANAINEGRAAKGKAPITPSLASLDPVATRLTLEKCSRPVTDSNAAHVQMAVKVADLLDTPDDQLTTSDIALKKQIGKAKSEHQIRKALSSDATRTRHRETAERMGDSFSSKQHTLLQGDCLEVMQDLKVRSFDWCITDPPYGMGADTFGDAGGKMPLQVHNYVDSLENWLDLMPKALSIIDQLLRKDAVWMMACDIRNFYALRTMVADLDTGWRLFHTPIIQHKVAGGRVPWKDKGFRRCYEVWLYAERGERTTHNIIPDVIASSSDRADQYGANKPVALMEEFLSFFSQPGDKGIDPFAGTGPIIPAAHGCKNSVTIIEQQPEQYGRCLSRIRELDGRTDDGA